MMFLQMVMSQLSIYMMLMVAAGLAMLVIWVAKDKNRLPLWMIIFLAVGVVGTLLINFLGYYLAQGTY